MHEERPSRIDGAVVWANRSAGGLQRVLPDGCMDLVWQDGELMVAGPDTVSWMSTYRPGQRFVGLRFAPGIGPAVFGAPADAFRDERIPLAAVWAHAERAAEYVAGAPDAGAALERLAAERLRTVPPPDPSIGAIVAHMRAGRPVRDAADALGYSARQLHRRSLAAFGYGPKTLAVILRMTRALDLARTGVGLAEVAATNGYADQAHLARDVRALAGIPVTQLLAG